MYQTESSIINSQRIGTMLQNNQFEAAKLASIQEIRKMPASPQLWMYLAETLKCLGQHAAAWKAYDRVWLLDPAATWVDDVKRELSIKNQGKIPSWLTDLLRVPNVAVSAAMIVKNEEEVIGNAIRALKPAVDEIVVVDTGSTDGTAAIAEELGAKVYHFAWGDDFAAARNFGLEKVTSDWVLWVDADEVLEAEDVNSPRTIAALFDKEEQPFVIRPTLLHHIENRIETVYDVPRFFSKRFDIRWFRRIHEQVGFPSANGIVPVTESFPVRIRLHHEGYQPSVVQKKNKLQRNIQLLIKTLEENPRDLGAYGYLGRELFVNGQYEEAAQILAETEQLAKRLKEEQPNYGRLPEVRHYLALALEKLQRDDEAIHVLQRSVRENPDFPAAWHELGILKLRQAQRLLKEAGESFLQAHNQAPLYRGIVAFDKQIGHWKAAAGLADVKRYQGNWTEATDLYEQILQVTPENQAIQDLLIHLKWEANQITERFQKMD